MYKKKSRRTYGEGSVSVNNFLGRYTVVWYTLEGKRKTCSKFPLTPEGYKEAEKFLQQMNGNRFDGIGAEADTQLAQWMAGKINADSMKNRKTSINNKAATALMLGKYAWDLIKMPIGQITAQHVQNVYHRMLEEGVTIPQLHRAHIFLHGVFGRAKLMHAVRFNIMDEVTKPKYEPAPIEIMTYREMGRLFHCLRKQQNMKYTNARFHNYYLYFRILAQTGMRIGELLALRWSDVDIRHREIHICQTATGYNHEDIGKPKTASGDRYIPIMSNRLLAMLEKAKIEGMAHGNEYIVETRNHTRIQYPSIMRYWSMVRTKAGVNKNIHCLRHTFATRMLSAGFPILEVTRILGHKKSSLTLEMYGHSIPRYNAQLVAIYNRKLKDK